MQINASIDANKVSKSDFTHTSANLFKQLPEELQDSIWDNLRNWRLKKTLFGHIRPVTALSYSGNGRYIASGSFDTSIKLWDTTTSFCLLTIKGAKQNPDGHSQQILKLMYLEGDTLLASWSQDQKMKLWDISTGQCLQTIEDPNPALFPRRLPAYSPDKNQYAIGSYDRAIKIFERSPSYEEAIFKNLKPQNSTF